MNVSSGNFHSKFNLRDDECSSACGTSSGSISGMTFNERLRPACIERKGQRNFVNHLYGLCGCVLILTFLLIYSFIGVQSDILRLRQDLDRLEDNVRIFVRVENGTKIKSKSNHSILQNWQRILNVSENSSRDFLETENMNTGRIRRNNNTIWKMFLTRPKNRISISEWSVVEEENLGGSDIERLELGPNEGERGKERPRRRRLRRSADEVDGSKLRNKQKKPNDDKKEPKLKPKPKGKPTAAKPSAVHFVPKNSSSRTITTERGSPVLSFWEPVIWANMTSQSFYHYRGGTVTILEDGVYFIYAQLVFHDLSGRWSFSININERQELKCINSELIDAASTLHPTNHGVYQHCFSSRLFHIRRLEYVTVRSLYEQRYILLSPEFTFWGIIKMS